MPQTPAEARIIAQMETMPALGETGDQHRARIARQQAEQEELIHRLPAAKLLECDQ